MNKDSKAIFFIPFRSGSKGFKDKNIINYKNKPLYMHTVNKALETKLGEVFVSTDYDADSIKEIPNNINLIKRKKRLAEDDTEIAEVIADFIDNNVSEELIIILLQVTSPNRSKKQIIEALSLFKSSNFDLVMSVNKTSSSILKYGRLNQNKKFQPISDTAFCFKNRQDLPEVYKPNGSIYIFNSRWFKLKRSFETENIGAYVMDQSSSIDIDSMEDLVLLEKLK